MANFKPAYSSERLSEQRMLRAFDQLPNVLRAIFDGKPEFEVSYGWACNLHTDLLWKPMKVHAHLLETFLQDSIRQQIVVPGESDLHIKSPDENLILTMCHESDIHVDGTDDCMQQFLSHELLGDIRFYSRDELRKMYPERFKDTDD